MEEHRIDQKRGVFSEIFGLMTSRRVRFSQGSKDTFDGSAQGKPTCEVDSNEGLADGRMEGRTGVHVESEVVLQCEGNYNEGVCMSHCAGCENDFFARHNDSC